MNTTIICIVNWNSWNKKITSLVYQPQINTKTGYISVHVFGFIHNIHYNIIECLLIKEWFELKNEKFCE